MPSREPVARLSAALVARAGGYLRNPVRQDRVTCAVCTTPVEGHRRCFQCEQHRRYEGVADVTGFMTYAVGGQQSGYVMRGYKAPRPLDEHRAIVTLLALLALSRHGSCPEALGGDRVTYWATVPSLPAKPGEHPFHGIIHGLISGGEVPLASARAVALTAVPKVHYPRGVSPDHFQTSSRLARGSHVLLMDDTWTGGGHAQSAALALRKAGAARVSLLVIARWIKEDFGNNAQFLGAIADHDYDSETCPWTGGGCPLPITGR